MDKAKVWTTVLENLRLNLSSANFATWFSQTFIVRSKKVDENRQIVEIGCPSAFIGNTIENRYYSLIKEVLDQATGEKNDLVFVIKQIKSKRVKPARRRNGEQESKKDSLFEAPEETTEKSRIQEAIKRSGLRPDFNFNNFAVSSTNQMAYAAATAVAKKPGKTYNPLFLYGGVGVGKTHLMQAAAQDVLARSFRAKIVYCTGEDFTNEIVNAIRRKTTDEFKLKYRSTQMLLVDDIQFIAGKDRAQEEFFHTFNALSRAGGQTILTSDRPPHEISKLEDRLRSRFEGGLMIDIQPPDFELRTAILLIKAQQQKANLPMDVAQLVASNITSTRRLEGFLARLITESQIKNEPITPNLVRALLGKTDETSTPKRLVKPKEIMRAVASHYNLKIGQLTGPKRDKPIALPRQVLMYILRTELEIPYMEIGRLLGDRDHTTVMHGVEKITNLLPTAEGLRVDIAGIKNKLYG